MKPILCDWDGDCLRPVGRGLETARDQWIEGQRYTMEALDIRSAAEHRRYFALVHLHWLQIPEKYGNEWPTAEAFRKWALIQAGYYNTRIFACESEGEAKRQERWRMCDEEYVKVERDGCTVFARYAASQSGQAMSRRKFHNSAEAVLGVMERVTGIPSEELGKVAA